jgi:hypothetical protein
VPSGVRKRQFGEAVHGGGRRCRAQCTRGRRVGIDNDDVANVGEIGGDGQQVLEEPVVDDDRGALGLVEQVGEEITAVGDVDRHLDDPGAREREPRDEVVGTVRQHDGARFARSETETSERLGECVRARVELGEGELIAFELDGDGVGMLVRARGNERPERLLPAVHVVVPRVSCVSPPR